MFSSNKYKNKMLLTYIYHGANRIPMYVHRSNCKACVYTSITMLITMYVIYIILVFFARIMNEYKTRNDFMLDLFIPFYGLVRLIIKCFRK